MVSRAPVSICVEITPDPCDSAQMPPQPKLVFVTSTTFFGDILGASADGLVGADYACNELASAAGKSRSFEAWLSDSSCAVADACRGFIHQFRGQ